MKMIRRVRHKHIMAHLSDNTQWWIPGEPWVWDCRVIDICSTLVGAIKNAPPGMVALSIRTDAATPDDLHKIERTARRRGARLIWLKPGLAVMGEPDRTEPIKILSHCGTERLTHGGAPESMLIVGWGKNKSQPLEHIDVIEPIEMTPAEFTAVASHRYVENKIRIIDATRSGENNAN